MSAITDTPSNRNFLSPLNFTFKIQRAPHVNFFIQKVNLPGLSVQPIMVSNPMIKVPYSGEHLSYEEFKITFRVDEDLQNYMEIYNWIIGLSKPDNYDEYKNLQNQKPYTGGGIVSDLNLTLLTAARNSNYLITFVDAFPVSLDSLQFDTTSSDVNFLDVTASFRYTSFNITNVFSG